MVPQSENEAVAEWWQDPSHVHTRVHGVFEGGGAKGVLYVGAIEGVLKRKVWFSAVAGSSAGAITAAMIAAGLKPEEMRHRVKRALAVMALPRISNGWRRLRNGTGFLDHQAVRRWLRSMLRAQAVRLGGDKTADGPTFRELYALTRIELHVVAVDLSARRLIVFNRTLTPDANVADSVMASATIPMAFEPLMFGTPKPETTIDPGTPQESASHFSYRMIADGGIASNFPSFVFRDDGFRAFANLDPISDSTPIVGFLLDEEKTAGQDLRDIYRRGQFVGTLHDAAAREVGTARWADIPRFRRRSRRSVMNASPIRAAWRGVEWLILLAELVLLKPILGLAKLVERETPSSWPASTNRHARLWMPVIQSLISMAPLPLIIGLGAFCWIFWVGFNAVAASLYSELAASATQVGDVYELISFVLGLVLGSVALVLATWMFLLALVTVALLRIAYPTMGLLGHELINTFLQAPGELPWAGHGKNETLVRLPVPPGLSTLGARADLNLDHELQVAEDAAYKCLATLFEPAGWPTPS